MSRRISGSLLATLGGLAVAGCAPPDGMSEPDWSADEAGIRTLFEELSVEDIRFVSRDAAVVESSAITRLGDGDTRDRATAFVVRRDDGWKIAGVRVMTVEPAAGGA